MAAATLEYDALTTLGTLSLSTVAAIEEAAKLIVPLALILLNRRRITAVDGCILGVAAGAGFAALETLGYAAVAFIQNHTLTGSRRSMTC